MLHAFKLALNKGCVRLVSFTAVPKEGKMPLREAIVKLNNSIDGGKDMGLVSIEESGN